MSDGYILSIEAAIAGGSIALAAGKRLVAEWAADSDRAESEKLLLKISEILADAGASRNELIRIAVSNGPGSYTGIRVGIATALGLADALGIPCVGISLLSSIGRTQGGDLTRAAVVPVGRGRFCWQVFSSQRRDISQSDKMSGTISELLEFAANEPDVTFLLHSDAFEQMEDHLVAAHGSVKIHNIGRNLAALLVMDAESINEGLEPYYARETKSVLPAGGLIAG